MTGDVPPARQCTMPGCSAEEVDPTNQAGLCSEHGQRVSGESDEESAEGPGSTDSNPRVDGDEVDSETVPREDAVAALRDVLQFYHDRVDDDIEDHTESGEHPDRPTTAREYFTEVRGWSDETVSDLLLGWAPPDHADRLVAYLFDRGHDRETILATGAVGESDSGGFYTTFAGRYVLPYYDENGEPAYAIARCTGGQGGGAKGYGGHPRDYQAGKYAKLRHTDVRVPFDESIYGLDTLNDDRHVLVAEGIADAITAREAGYAVLSPVAKEFKQDHFSPLVEALEGYGIDRVTVVADADNRRQDTDGEGEPDSIHTAVGRALAPVAPGLAGALRTAAGVKERTEGLDVRVGIPPAPGETTSDLDEYVTEWGGDLGAILRSARPPEMFPEFEAADSGRSRAGPERSGDNTERVEINVEVGDAPDDLPLCYKSALEARTAPGSTGFDSNHDLNLLVANLGVYAGYETDTLTEQFEEYPLNNDDEKFDAGLTRKAIEATRRKIDKGDLAPPSAGYLREKAVLEDGCSCHIHSKGGEYEDDPTEADVVLEPRRAWDAAGRVTPDDLDTALGLAESEDGEGWETPNGTVTDVARAVAFDSGLIEDADGPLTDVYADAYQRAREVHGARLPEYLSAADAVQRFDRVLGAIRELSFWHLDEDALTVEITGHGGDVDGDAVRTLDPTPVDGWRDSDSGESVLVFESGTVWDANAGDDGEVIDALRFVALDAGIIAGPQDPLAGEDFTQAYRVAREKYGAPLPRWQAGDPDVTPVLPPASDLVDAIDSGAEDIDDVREEVEELYRDLATDDKQVHVLNVLPALGKTTSAIKTAADKPSSYFAPRKELMEQAAVKADKHGVSYKHLPIFSERTIDEAAVAEVKEYVREEGMKTLKNQWELLSVAGGDLEDAGDGDEDEVTLGRATCPTAEGGHGDEWALAVHVARKLDYTPRDIHERPGALFGAELPCQHDGDCAYSEAWEEITNPDAPIDLLIGHYIHANVESARTHYDRSPNGRTQRTPRTLIVDEFPGLTYAEPFGENVKDHITWLAGALSSDVDDFQDLLEQDLWNSEFVQTWLAGEAAEDENPAAEPARALAAREQVHSAVESAEMFLAEYHDLLEEHEIADTLQRLVDEYPNHTPDDRGDISGSLNDAFDGVPGDVAGFNILKWIVEEVASPLAESTDHTTDVCLDDVPGGGELVGLVERAIEAADACEDGAVGILQSAQDALAGGNQGARELAVWADDGYAHRQAHYLLEAALTPDDENTTARVNTTEYTFGDDDATLKHVQAGPNEEATVVLDRDYNGAEVLSPPSRNAGSGTCPVVGLDATARSDLWELALGQEVQIADVHGGMQERASALRDLHGLQMVQTTDLIKSYEGDPDGKNTDADVALLEEIADQFAGVHGPRDRGEDAVTFDNPAAITTKVVREVLEDDERAADAVSEWENFGNLTGDNSLGKHRLAALLGCQHYGDRAVERMAAFAGEEVNRQGYGHQLDYDSGIANTYLKHMREDQVMQAALRFTRGETGAIVFAHTAALREDLPVVGEGQVMKSWSETAGAIAEEWRRQPDGEFTAGDVADAVDVTKRQVRRVLAEFVNAGYLERHDPGEGRANNYSPLDQPGAGEVALDDVTPEIGGEPGQNDLDIYYTVNVRVSGLTGHSLPRTNARGSTLPAPSSAEVSAPPG